MTGVRARGARVLITGAGSGIGKATALRFAACGAATVICVDIDGARAVETAEGCAGVGQALTCDVASWDAIRDLAERVHAEGPLDILVNNAGVGIVGPFLATETTDWDWLLGINLDGVASCCRAFGAAMVQRRRGAVVNVASGAAVALSRDMPAYCASKAAVVALSRCLRADWADAGVGVSAICPGLIATNIATANRMVGPLAGRNEQAQRRMDRGRSPDTVAKAIVRAAERDSELVPVGIDAVIAHRLLPFVPGPIKSRLTRISLADHL